MSTHTHSSAYRLTESAIMIAFAAVLSVLKILDMPYGGSVTAFSMLPLLIVAYRYGMRWGLFTAVTYGLVQLLLGLDNLSYATSFPAAVAIIVWDYLAAFLVLGLAGAFRNDRFSQGTSLAFAAIATGILRYLCHVIAGCTVWAGLSVPTIQATIYSLSYNATYMIPEIIILTLGAVYISRFLSFTGVRITRAAGQAHSRPVVQIVSVLSKTILLAAAVIIVLLIAPTIQFTDGTLFLAGIANANWPVIGIVALSAVLLSGVLEGIVRVCQAQRRGDR